MEMEPGELSRQFTAWVGVRPTVFSAPGRVNLIGEHTDYNDGFVMPSAIGFSTRVAASGRDDRRLVIRSGQFPGEFEFDLDDLPARGAGNWCDYVVGVAVVLRQAGHTLKGANLLVQGEVPIGAGLSSSAAIEVACALALMGLNGIALPMIEVAKLCQRSENAFIGARVGIMDQFVSCLGKARHALLLDCRSLEFELVPIPERVRMVVCNTMVKHAHAGGEYNLRREECEEGVRILAGWYPGIRALRDVSGDQLAQHAGDVPEKIFKRCRHVVEENARVQEGARRLRAGDLDGFGKLMRESHRSLRDLYEVSCRELDVMVEVAEGLAGYYGGRMTGGGFGGCTVNLVEADLAEAFAGMIADRYRRATGIRPDVYICSAADGAGVEG
ncbi:MAG TPA: galactokinase [Candidatus Dormibacteraeota bacterium]|jgi:galactokinase|nr:galactokinase [Candidatus Dormibacteraeota bacterium]